MNALLHASVSDLWSLVGWTMVHFLWLGGVVAVVAMVARVVLRSAPPSIRYAVAIGSLIALAALPPATAMWLFKHLPPTQVFTAESPAVAAQISAPIASASALDSAGGDLATAAQTSAASALPPLSNPRQSRELPAVTAVAPLSSSPASFNELLESCVAYLPWLWLIGTPLTFALLVSGVVGTRRLGRSSHTIDSDPIVELLAHLASSLRITRRVTVAVCDRIASPVLIGIIRPMILLPPAALTGWSPDEIEMVLLHELAHVRRWDNFVNLLQRCVESLLFFHPAVWLISDWARREREACCDATVVARTNRPHAYAELLVALAAQLPRSVLFHPAASSAMSAGPLRSRIRQILKLEEDPMLVSGKSLTLMLGSLFAAILLFAFYFPTIGHADPKESDSGKMTSVASALDEYRNTLVTYDLGFDSVFPQQPWTANDPERLKRYPTADAWPNVLGHVDSDASAFRSVREKSSTTHENVTGPNAYFVPLSWGIGTKNYATLLFLEGIEKDAHVVANSYTSFASFGPMAGDLVFASYATALVHGDMSGQITANSYFDLVVTGKLTGQITTQSYAMIYLMGGFTGHLELKHSRVYIAGNTTKGDLARIKGAGQVYLEESDLSAGKHQLGQLEVTVKNSSSTNNATLDGKSEDSSLANVDPNVWLFELKGGESGAAELLLNGKPTDDDQLRAALPRDAKTLDNLLVSLTAEKGVRYGDVVKVVDRLEALGFKKLALDTRGTKRDQPNTAATADADSSVSVTADEIELNGSQLTAKGDVKFDQPNANAASPKVESQVAEENNRSAPQLVRSLPEMEQEFQKSKPDAAKSYQSFDDEKSRHEFLKWAYTVSGDNAVETRIYEPSVVLDTRALQHEMPLHGCIWLIGANDDGKFLITSTKLGHEIFCARLHSEGVDGALPKLAPQEYTTKTYQHWLTLEKEEDPTQFPYQVQFEKGASKFLDGDEITIDEIRGTAEEFEPGNNYWIKGKYKLHSHSRAQLSAFTTAKEAKDGIGPVQSIQTKKISQGDADFTIILPMTIRGWPHLSFYANDSGEGFGGIYFGTGDSVLNESWAFGKLIDEEKRAKSAEARSNQSNDTADAKDEQRTRFEHFGKSLKTIELVIAVFNDSAGYSHQLEPVYKNLIKDHHSLDLWGSKVDPKSPDAERYHLTGAPTCIVFRNGQEIGRLAPIKDAEQLKRFIELAAGARKVTVKPDGSVAVEGLEQYRYTPHVTDSEKQGVSKPSTKFPSFEEQKLADLAFKRLGQGLELEPLDEVDLNRVKAFGYDGGVKVTSGAAGLSGLENSTIQTGDILVGLGIWPTSNMKAVGEILTGPEIAELNPVKFYVVRGETLPAPTGAIPQQRDAVHTGRVEIHKAGPPDEHYSTAAPTSGVAGSGVVGLAPHYPSGPPATTANQLSAQVPKSQPVQLQPNANPYASPTPATSPSPFANNMAEASKRLEDALKRKTEAIEKRTAAKTDEEVEKTKRDLDAANKQLEQAKSQLEQAKLQQEKANGLPVGPANATTQPTAAWQTSERGRAGDSAGWSQSTSATPEELEILRDRVKMIGDQMTLTAERYKAGKGATDFDVKRVAIDLALAESDFALADGHRDVAIKKLQDARKQAEEVAELRKASARAGIESPDLEEVMKATQNVSDIKLKLIRLQKEVTHPEWGDNSSQPTVSPTTANPFAANADGKTSVHPPLPAVPATAQEQVLRTPFVGEADTTQKHDSPALATQQSHPIEVPSLQANPKDTPAPDTHPNPSVDPYHKDNSTDGRNSRLIRTETNHFRLSKNASEAQSDDRIVVAYDIPAELMVDVKRMREFPTEIHGEFGSGGRYFLQGTPERQKRFQQLLDATPKWRDPEAAKSRAKQVYVKTEKDGQEYLEWKPAGLTFTNMSNPKFPHSGFGGGGWAMSSGAVVAEVVPGSPADWNGIEPGDIMTKLGSFETKSLSELESLLKSQGNDYSTNTVRCMIFRFSSRGDSGQLPGSLNLATDRTQQKQSAPTDDIAAEQPQTTIADHAKPPSSVATTEKSALRYDDKTFDEWRYLLTNELSTEKRIEAIKALAAFGRAGYAKEASQAILDIAGDYDFYIMDGRGVPEGQLKEIVLNVLTPGSRTQSLAKYWVPDLVGRLADDANKWKWLAYRLFENLNTDDAATISAVEQVTNNADTDLRSIALRVIVTSDRVRNSGTLDNKTQQLLATALQSKNPAEVTAVLNSLVYKSPDGSSISEFNPTLATLVFDKNSGVQLAARNVLKYLAKEDAAKLVDKYTAVLNDESRKSDHVAAIRALGAIGTSAGASAPQLEKIFSNEKQELLSRVAAAFAIDRIEDGVRYRNMLQNVENAISDEKIKTQFSHLANEETQLQNR